MLPTVMTSLYALAYSLLVSAGGGSRRNALALGTPNGVMFCHWNAMPDATPFTIGQLRVACHSPGTAGPGALNSGGADPSWARRAVIAAAAASPTPMPSVLP